MKTVLIEILKTLVTTALTAFLIWLGVFYASFPEIGVTFVHVWLVCAGIHSLTFAAIDTVATAVIR